MLRLIKWLVILAVLFVAWSWLDQHLPRHDIVRIAGTDIKRLDSSGFFDSESPTLQATKTRDVRFINTVYPTGEVRVFRNEDTAWTFPWYAKFDSGNLQALAQALTSGADKPQWVVIESYGWRVPYLTMFPNALSIRKASGPDETIIPWFNIIFLSACGLILLWLYILWRRFRRRWIAPLLARWRGEPPPEALAIEDETPSLPVAIGRSPFGRLLDAWRARRRR